MRHDKVFGHICLPVSVDLSVMLLTSENLDLESSFLVCRYIFRRSRSSSHIKVIRSRSENKKSCLYILFTVFGFQILKALT